MLGQGIANKVNKRSENILAVHSANIASQVLPKPYYRWIKMDQALFAK